MSWRLERAAFNRQKGAGNKAAMRSRVKDGHTPGILLYKNGRAAGWCSVAPRQEFVALERSRVWKPVDDCPVWSISCFFVAKEHRGRGLSVKLIKSAVSYARQQGAKIIEGYPQELTCDKLPAAFV